MSEGFRVVGQEEPVPDYAAQQAVEREYAAQQAMAAAQAQQARATQLLMLALRALGQRSVVALGNLVSLLLAASVFAVWLRTPDPGSRQLLSLGMYAVFILLAIFLIRRRIPAAPGG